MPNFIDKVTMKDVNVVGTDGSLYNKGVALGNAADVNRGSMKKVTGSMARSDVAGGVFAWANPETGYILVRHVVINLTTKATGACTLDVGTTAVSAATSSDNLIDGKDINAAAGIFTNDESAGTNGKAFKRLATGKWVTASVASGASAGLVGTYEIYYEVL